MIFLALQSMGIFQYFHIMIKMIIFWIQLFYHGDSSELNLIRSGSTKGCYSSSRRIVLFGNYYSAGSDQILAQLIAWGGKALGGGEVQDCFKKSGWI